MIISIIASVSSNNVIGKNGKLPWHIPEDLNWFKEKTMGHFVLIGRKTYESIGKTLEGRKIIVLTKDLNYRTNNDYIVHSIEEAIDIASKSGENELFIAGGEELYRQTIELADRIYLTRILNYYDGDSFLPEFNKNNYSIVYRRSLKTNPPIEFLVYKKLSL